MGKSSQVGQKAITTDIRRNEVIENSYRVHRLMFYVVVAQQYLINIGQMFEVNYKSKEQSCS